MKKVHMCSVALQDLGSQGTVILVYPLLTQKLARHHFFPRAYVQCALPVGMPFLQVYLSAPPPPGGGAALSQKYMTPSLALSLCWVITLSWSFPPLWPCLKRQPPELSSSST